MQLHDFLWTAGILLAVLAAATQIFSRLRLGAVLGTLVAGVILGPWGANLAHDVDRARNFTELGVVFLMFTIGLEMDFAKLSRMRRLVFGLGSLQILVSGALIALLFWSLGGDGRVAILGGTSKLSLVVTAIGPENAFDDAGERNTPHGDASFATLLVQDLAVVPLLALVPLLGGRGGSGESFSVVAPKIGSRWLAYSSSDGGCFRGFSPAH